MGPSDAPLLRPLLLVPVSCTCSCNLWSCDNLAPAGSPSGSGGGTLTAACDSAWGCGLRKSEGAARKTSATSERESTRRVLGMCARIAVAEESAFAPTGRLGWELCVRSVSCEGGGGCKQALDMREKRRMGEKLRCAGTLSLVGRGSPAFALSLQRKNIHT